MGITHSWYRPQTIDANLMHRIKSDFMTLIPSLPGKLVIKIDDLKQFGNEMDDLIFNGVYGTCDPFVFRRISQNRVITIDRAREPWQVNLVFEYCKTQGLPYDSAVKIALLTIKDKLEDTVWIFTDQKESDWKMEMEVYRSTYGDTFRIIRNELILV